MAGTRLLSCMRAVFAVALAIAALVGPVRAAWPERPIVSAAKLGWLVRRGREGNKASAGSRAFKVIAASAANVAKLGW